MRGARGSGGRPLWPYSSALGVAGLRDAQTLHYRSGSALCVVLAPYRSYRCNIISGNGAIVTSYCEYKMHQLYIANNTAAPAARGARYAHARMAYMILRIRVWRVHAGEHRGASDYCTNRFNTEFNTIIIILCMSIPAWASRREHTKNKRTV